MKKSWLVHILLVTGVTMASAAAPSAGKETIELEGHVVCIGCSLKKSDGVDAQCSLYAPTHEHGILVDTGQIWSIVDNERGHELRTNHDHLTQKVRLVARPLPRAQYLDVESFETLRDD